MIVFGKTCCGYCGREFKRKRVDAKYCSDSCGNSFRSKKWRSTNREEDLKRRRDYNDRRRGTPYGKYTDQKQRAKQRGIEFKLTFEDWWSLWEPYWDNRGVGKMVMCRTGDSGPYELGNVRIDTHANNNRESCETGARSSSI